MVDGIKNEELKEFFLKFAKDEKLFKTDDKEHQFIFTAGFIRGAMWALQHNKSAAELKKNLGKPEKPLIQHRKEGKQPPKPPNPPPKRRVREDIGRGKKKSW